MPRRQTQVRPEHDDEHIKIEEDSPRPLRKKKTKKR